MRGVLHRDKSSQPKINWWGGMEERKEGEKGKRERTILGFNKQKSCKQ